MKPTIAIAMSGGIDSLVSAHILKKTGAPVFGIHFTTGFELNRKHVDPDPIHRLGSQLDISIHTVDLKLEDPMNEWNCTVSGQFIVMFAEYQAFSGHILQLGGDFLSGKPCSLGYVRRGLQPGRQLCEQTGLFFRKKRF